MATITKKVDKSVQSGKRYQYWKSSENADDGTVIATADVFMIEASLHKPARYIYIETAAGTSLSIRFNSQVTQYPLRPANLNWPVPEKDLESPVVRTDGSMAAIEIGAEEIYELDNVLAISDIQIVSFTAGSFELLVI